MFLNPTLQPDNYDICLTHLHLLSLVWMHKGLSLTLAHLFGEVCLKCSATLILLSFSKLPSKFTCLKSVSKSPVFSSPSLFPLSESVSFLFLYGACKCACPQVCTHTHTHTCHLHVCRHASPCTFVCCQFFPCNVVCTPICGRRGAV